MSKTKTQIYVCSDPHYRTVVEKKEIQRSRRCPSCGKFMYHKGTRTTTR